MDKLDFMKETGSDRKSKMRLYIKHRSFLNYCNNNNLPYEKSVYRVVKNIYPEETKRVAIKCNINNFDHFIDAVLNEVFK